VLIVFAVSLNEARSLVEPVPVSSSAFVDIFLSFLNIVAPYGGKWCESESGMIRSFLYQTERERFDVITDISLVIRPNTTTTE